jgi:hypothetical protein
LAAQTVLANETKGIPHEWGRNCRRSYPYQKGTKGFRKWRYETQLSKSHEFDAVRISMKEMIATYLQNSTKKKKVNQQESEKRKGLQKARQESLFSSERKMRTKKRK